MKKLSKILKESIWSDLQDRSSGEVTRKEDDINHLDRNDLWKYMKDHYKQTKALNGFINLKTFNRVKTFNSVAVPILVVDEDVYYVTRDFNTNEVFIDYGLPYHVDGLFSKLNEKFIIRSFMTSVKEMNRYLIFPINGKEVDNNFFLEVVQFLLDNIPEENHGIKKVNESIWSDLQDRSSGEITRKEDDVNNLDIQGLCDYLKSKYKTSSENDIIVRNFGQDYLVICLLEDEIGHYKFLYYDGETINTQLDVLMMTGCYDEIKSKYTISEEGDDFNIKHVNIYPKDRTRVPVTNSFFIEVLDFILDKVNVPLEQQIEKINESIWSDLQDRSSGSTIRKEDAFNPDYVDFGKNTTVYWAVNNLEIDGEVKFRFNEIKDYNNNGWRLPTIEEVNQIDWKLAKFHIGYMLRYWEINILNNILKVKTNDNGGTYFWTCEEHEKYPTSAYAYGFTEGHFRLRNFNKTNNRLYAFLVKDKKYMNESIWSDLQDRSSGEVVRKEDSTDLLEMNEFFDYLDEHYEALTNHKIRKYDAIHCIIVPICGKSRTPLPSKNLFISIDYGEDGFNKKVTIGAQMLEDVPYMNKVIREHFYVVDKPANKDRGAYVEIYSLDDGLDITNTFILKTIDYLLDKAKNKYTILLKKK